jgi:hypothetical protein
MTTYLFVFGYESPAESRTNASAGTDFESSNAVWIEAASEEEALRAGRSYAERWVRGLFEEAGVSGFRWAQGGFAHWIEREPLRRFSGVALEALERIIA